MDTMQELIPFVKEMLSQKPNRRMLKIYVVGSVVALLGTVIGLVETVCQPFTSSEPMDAELEQLVARDQGYLEDDKKHRRKEVVATEKLKDDARPSTKLEVRVLPRGAANRLHAS